MLVLSRKKHQTILVGDSITITVVETGSDRVRIGVEAPREVPVHRGEVYAKIQKEKTAHG